MIWFKAPDQGHDIIGTLTEFAFTLERELPGFHMVHVLDDEDRLAAFLPKLTELCEQRRVLVVVDGIESLLSEGGQWIDDKWGQVIAAMCGHRGRGRVLLTSRRIPVSLDGRVRLETVDALSLDEALLLASELPDLRRLMDGQIGSMEPDVARSVARHVLDISQGHPKLLELADGQAANPDTLRKLVEAGDRAWHQAGSLPGGFFITGQSQAADKDYLHVLSAWTQAITAFLIQGHKDLFWVLCCLEEGDRNQFVVQKVWQNLRDLLARAGEPPSVDEGLAALAAQGLITCQPSTGNAAGSCSLHPVVAAAGRAEAGNSFQEAVDGMLAAYWCGSFAAAVDFEARWPTGKLLVQGGISAAPYLLRLGRWQTAFSLLQEALIRDRSRATAETALPALQAIAAAAQGTADEYVTARLLVNARLLIDPDSEEDQLRALLDASVARGDYRNAAVIAMDLIRHCRERGLLDEALALVEQQIDYHRRAGDGPWTKLGDQVQRLQVLVTLGRAEQAFAEVRRLRAYMDALPPTSEQPESVRPWSVRELLLETGAHAAQLLERWQDALDLHAAVLTYKKGRGASVTDIAQTEYNCYQPLIKLGRIDEALEQLVRLREVFEKANDIDALGYILSALANVEDERGHGSVAINLQRDALRYRYLARDVSSIVISHRNLGNMERDADQPSKALAHHLAAALICAVTGIGRLDSSIQSAADDLGLLGDDAEMPSNVEDLSRQLAKSPGVELKRLLMTLGSRPEEANQVLERLIARIRTLADARTLSVRPYLAAWDPVIAALLATRGGDRQAAAVLKDEVSRCKDSADRDALVLVVVLSRMFAGEPGQDLLVGLDEIDTAIAGRALDALSQRIIIPPALWPAVPDRWLLGEVVAAAFGDTASAENARQLIDVLGRDPDRAELAESLTAILEGERDSGLASRINDPTDSAVVATVLSHLGTAEPETA